MAICLICKGDPCTCRRDIDDRLNAAVEEFAALPQLAQEILENMSPASMAVALMAAADQHETLTIERDHYRDEWQKASIVVHALLADRGGAATFDVAAIQADGAGKMLDYRVAGGVLTVTIEEAPDGSEG